MTSRQGDPTHPTATLGATVRKHREQAGLSIRQLAAKVGVHYAYLSRVENGTYEKPAADVLQRVATALGIDPAKLLRFIGVKPTPAKLPTPHVYFRRAYHLTAEEAAEAERQIENILTGLRKHIKPKKGGTKP